METRSFLLCLFLLRDATTERNGTRYAHGRSHWNAGTAAIPHLPRSRIVALTTSTPSDELEHSIPLQFKLEARDVMKKDRNGASDPYVVVSYTQGNGSEEIPLGRTAVVMDNSNPKWSDVFNVTYIPGARQKMHFVLWDKDAYQDDRLGKVWTFLGDYVHNGEFAQRYLNPGFLIMEKA